MTEKPSDVDMEFAAVMLANGAPTKSRSLKTLAQYKEWADEQIEALRARVANQGVTIDAHYYEADEDLRRKLTEARVESRELRNRLASQTSVSQLRDENKDLRDELASSTSNLSEVVKLRDENKDLRDEKRQIRDAFRRKVEDLRVANNTIADLRAELLNAKPTKPKASWWITESETTNASIQRDAKIRKAMLEAAEKIIETLK